MAGFPDVPTSHALAVAALEAGYAGFEIGAPLPDPLADGATQQRVNSRALAGGAGLDTALDLARVIRQHSPETPVAVMSYYNPLRQRGDQRIAADLAAAGADAVIVPDLPVEESSELYAALSAHALALLPFLPPTTPTAPIPPVPTRQPI